MKSAPGAGTSIPAPAALPPKGIKLTHYPRGRRVLDPSTALDIIPGVATAGVGKNLDQALRWFRALSDETRLRLVDRLRDGEQCVCDLTDALDTGQSRLSFHLKTLKDAGIVTDRREGRWVYYALNPEVIEAMGRLLVDLRPTRTGLRVVSRRCD